MLGGGETSSRLLICDDWRLDGDDGWWSFPSLSLVVEEGGVGGKEKPDNICQTLIYKTNEISNNRLSKTRRKHEKKIKIKVTLQSLPDSSLMLTFGKTDTLLCC